MTQVVLRVGHLRQVVPEAMDLAWAALTDGTDLDGADLVVEAVPAVVHCGDCGADTELEWPVLACGTCGGRRVDLVSGEELLVVSIDVRDGAA